MRHYKKFFLWENKSARKTINDYKELVESYYALRRSLGINQRDSDEALIFRSHINSITPKVREMLLASDSMIKIEIGGGNVRRKQVDVVTEVFFLQHNNISTQVVIDMLERSLGKYENDYKNSIIRTFNPFFWLVLMIGYIMDLPFILWGSMGFDRKKAESSILGKIVKFIFGLVTFLASVATLFSFIVQIFEKFGHLDTLKQFLGIE